MSAAQGWIGRLEAEIARELGQSVTMRSGGEIPQPERSLGEALALPEARLLLAADAGDVSALLVEGRLIEADQADAATVRELWFGILSSVAARLGGRTESPEAGEAASAAAEGCVLQLGEVRVRIALAVLPGACAVPAAEKRVEAPQEYGGRREANFDLLLEVELHVAVRFGSREIELKELLELGPGDVVELDRRLSDPVDLIVGDKIVARGEVVLVNGNFGLRVSEVAEPRRRLESVRCLN